ncbi:MAG: Tyrosine recombinase XerD [Chloroflexota bacterium]
MKFVQLDLAIQMFLDHRRRRTLATRRQYRRWLLTWFDWLTRQGKPNELAPIEIGDFRDFLTYLEDEHVPHGRNPRRPAAPRPGLQPASVAAARRTLRAFWKYLDNEELLTPRQSRFFGNNRIPMPEVIEPPRPYIEWETLNRLLEACGDGLDETSARNRAILLLLYESGMRVGELCALEDNHVNLRERQAQVLGKGNQWRPVFWQPPGGFALIRYVLMRRGARDAGPLFRGTSTRNDCGKMSPDSVRSMIKRVAEDAGIALPPGCPVHWFRHGFAKRALEAGLDRSLVGQLLGHRNVKTTERYVREFPVRLKAHYDAAFGASVRRGRVSSADHAAVFSPQAEAPR